MIRLFRSALVASLLLLTAACAATRVTTAWKDPGATSVHFNKILVAAMTPSQMLRQNVEDHLVMVLGPDRATASYTLFPGEKAPAKETALATIAEKGYDAVLIMREAGTDVEVDYVPSTVGYSPVAVGWGPYWTSGWVATYSPGYMDTKVTMRIDVVVFDVKKDKPIWSSRSETKDPSSSGEVLEGVVKAVRSEMRSQHFIP